LHASLFAYAQNVPFASVRQEKVANYFSDRGLERFVFASATELSEALAEIQSGTVDFSESVTRDRDAVHAAYAQYASTFRRRSAPRADRAGEPSELFELNAERLLSAQRKGVIEQRDVVLHRLFLRALGAERNERMWHDEADRLAQRIGELEARPHPPKPAWPGQRG